QTEEKQAGQKQQERKQTENKQDKFSGRKPEQKKPFPVSRRDAQPKPQIGNWDVSEFVVEPEEGKKRFHDFELPREVMKAVSDMGFKYCTPIQAEILESSLQGRDAMGKAQTGTGKTAAFLITIITRLMNSQSQDKRQNGAPRSLILAPTRELALQIAKDAFALSKYTNLRVAAVMGGLDYQKQKSQMLYQNIDILVATPGRLLDFYESKSIHLNKVEIMVIDEADRMLDMGFIPDVKKVMKSLPFKEKRQTLLFSATLNTNVIKLSSMWTVNPSLVEIDPGQVEVSSIDQRVYALSSSEKRVALLNLILKEKPTRTLIFVNRRDETRRIYEMLYKHGYECGQLTGDVDQKKRIRTLDNFKAGIINILVATDVAGRGLHVDNISHVINYNLPEDAEDYVHRIGRTGRAGMKGVSISLADEEGSFYIRSIEKYVGHKLKVVQIPEEYLIPLPPPVRELPEKKRAESGRA
ncbi:MAG TPA: DEAD/DEAH box helicase, partial [Ignavibacteriales bacterium]|nr:DEAD/DEAH box helicase [Ignavibacteriales bacterium]